MTAEVILALFLSTLLSLRMTFWLINPKKHQGLALGLYSAKGVWIKRVIYFGLFLILSYLIIKKGSIVDYILALFAIGALFDFFFTFFRYPNTAETKIIEIPALTPIRYFIAIPLIILTIWLYIFIFVH